MNELRSTFLASAGAARAVVALPEVGDRWREPSALKEMTVGALTAHLVRAVTNAERYLEGPHVAEGDRPPVSAARYFLPVDADLDSAVNLRVRTSSAEEALVGQRALVGRMDRALERLGPRLEQEPDDPAAAVHRMAPSSTSGEALSLDEYLRSRIIELTLHTDDLCASLGRETPPLPGIEVAIAALLDVATLRHGRLAVLRALARRERDTVQALRVI